MGDILASVSKQAKGTMTTILVVEDEITLLETLAYNLRQEGYEVLEPARDYRNRHASIMLALEAAAEAMAQAENAACA